MRNFYQVLHYHLATIHGLNSLDLRFELIESSFGTTRDLKSVICRAVITFNMRILFDFLQFENFLGANSAKYFLKYQTQMLI
jgi:hypothetical protein